MDTPIKKTSLLIIKGVKLKDLSEPSNHQSIVSNTLIKHHYQEPVYTEMPKRFTGAASWIKFSNLLCWECSQLPLSYPKFIPLYMDANAAGEVICDVYGHFCEWNCAIRYISREFSRDRRPDLVKGVVAIESKFTGHKREIIPPAPAKTEMKEYCGAKGITAAQWRDKLSQINNDYGLTHYKLEHHQGDFG
jgi:hypothetical protein